MTITCPRCGLAFETQATTNTRCRRCKTVVRVGTGSPRQPTRATELTDAVACDDSAGGGLVLVAFGLVLACYVIPPIVRAVRRRRADRAPTLAADGAVGESGPFSSPPARSTSHERT